ncbi:MAG: adenylate kinase [Chloroflexi bacterium]|nr:adenylate kinase [Chloroflexota bacterium]MDA1173495.1 adenylate kinase [Chloroflexota bacterium]
MRMVLLGAPGAGKGTQASVIADQNGVAHVASGDLFRKHLGEGTDLGKLAKTFMDKGDLVPDDVTVKMVLERIAEPDAAGGYVLDGFPRTGAQAEALDAALVSAGQVLDIAPLIEVDTEELVRRLAGRWICRVCQIPYHEITAPPKQTGVCDKDGGELYQRDDDKAEVVRARLQTYQALTAPLIDYYEGQSKLVRVNGQQDVEKVTADLLAAVSASAVS